jgi:flagellin
VRLQLASLGFYCRSCELATSRLAIDAAAEFGAAQIRIDAQNDFLKKQADALKVGVGALVDADMEEASARLQALQVQQQLATQSLSIANQAPQNILSLFR